MSYNAANTLAPRGITFHLRTPVVLALLGLLTAFESRRATLFAQGTAFTYQGRLMESNAPATGSFEFEFSLFDRAAGGSKLGTITLEETPVTNGLFTVVLDFGAAVFTGAPRWLEVYARNDGAGGPGVVLTPRQQIRATPYAIFAGQAGTAATATQLTGTLPAGQIAGQITAPQLTNGAIANQHVSPTAAIDDTKLATLATAGKVANSATTATSANSPNTIVLRNASGSFSAQQIVALGGFAGNGSDLTGLDADSIQFGTLDDSRLSASVTRLGSSIDPSELTKPYQSGTIPSTKAETTFWRMTYPVAFNPPFASPPNVTLGLNTTDLSALDILKVSVAGKSAAGFTASAVVPVPEPSVLSYYCDKLPGLSCISVNGAPGVFFVRDYSNVHENEIWFATLVGGTNWQQTMVVSQVPVQLNGLSGAMIQGRPAVVFQNQTNSSLRYVRAANATGSAWGSPVTVAQVAGSDAEPFLTEVQQRPAVAFIGTNAQLKYIRSSDSIGASWGTALTVDPQASSWPSLTIVNGNPAIAAYRDSSGLMFHRANDAVGSTWTSVIVQSNVFFGVDEMYHGYYPMLAVVNGNPAIAYQRGPDFIYTYPAYIRAADVNGTAWGAPRQLNPFSTTYGRQSLIVADGRPAICFPNSGSPRFVQAADATGDSWGPVINLAADIDGDYAQGFNGTMMQKVGGVPWVFYLTSGSYLRYTRAVLPEFQIDWTATAP